MAQQQEATRIERENAQVDRENQEKCFSKLFQQLSCISGADSTKNGGPFFRHHDRDEDIDDVHTHSGERFFS